MDTLSTVLIFLTGVVLRLGIPIAVTALVIYLLRRLDARWQAEAKKPPLPLAIKKPECWKVKGCTLEQRRNCPAFASDEPCWQVNRQPNGYLKEECLACDVFRKAPLPAHV